MLFSIRKLEIDDIMGQIYWLFTKEKSECSKLIDDLWVWLLMDDLVFTLVGVKTRCARVRQSYSLIRCSWKGALGPQLRKGRGDLVSGIGLGAMSRRCIWTRMYACSSQYQCWKFSLNAKTGLPLCLILALAPNSCDVGQETLCMSLWNGVDGIALILLHKLQWYRTGSFKAKSSDSDLMSD